MLSAKPIINIRFSINSMNGKPFRPRPGKNFVWEEIQINLNLRPV